MFWFEITQNKDGSIHTCVQVSTGMRDGKYVHYVQAASAEAAIQILLDRYNNKLDRGREKARARVAGWVAAGLCRQCGGEKPDDQSRCDTCAKRHRESEANTKRGNYSRGPYAQTDAEKVGVVQRQFERERVKKGCGPSPLARTKRAAFQAALKAFDTMTAGSYRAWLAEQLHKAQEQERASACRRAVRFGERAAVPPVKAAS